MQNSRFHGHDSNVSNDDRMSTDRGDALLLSSSNDAEQEETPSFRSVAVSSPAPTLFQPPLFAGQSKTSSFLASGLASTLNSVATTTNSFTSKTATLSAVPSHGWKQPQLTDRGCFSFLEPYHKHILESQLDSLLQFLPRLFHQLSLHVVEYCDSPILARATTLEQTDLCVSVMRDTNVAGHVVVQVQRRSGCSIVFGKYAREIMQQLEAFVEQQQKRKVTATRGQSTMPANEALPMNVTVSSQFHANNLLGDHHHGPLAQTVWERFGVESPHRDAYHFHDVTDASVLADTSAMLQCYGTRYLALEALTLLTDPSKTVKSVADQVSRILLGDNGANDNNESIYKMTHTVVRLAVSGTWDDGDDDDDMEVESSDHRAQCLALRALVNAMHVINCDSEQSLHLVNQACRSHTGQEWKDALWARLHAAPHQPHAAFLAARGLCRLYQQPSSGNAAGMDSTAAERALLCPHAALQDASQQLLDHLKG